ncbi:glutamate ligase domain-containing protein [Streptomyces eurythermus]
MKAAFTVLQCMADGRRTIAVLGEMQELGEDGGEEHRQVGRLSATAGIHMLIAVGGDDAQTMADAAQQDDPQLKVVAARERLSRPRPQPGPRDAPAPGHRPGQGLPQGRAGARGGAPGRARHHERRPRSRPAVRPAGADSRSCSRPRRKPINETRRCDRW